MLWVNLIMDTLASLALATEPPTPQLLLRKPYGRTKALISRTMMKNIFGQAVYQLFVTFGLLFAGDLLLDIESGRGQEINAEPTQHFTVVFNTFVFMTLFNELNAREIHGERNIFRGLFSNPIFYTIWITTFVLQIVIVQYGSLAFQTAALNIEQWLWCIFLGLGTLLWGQIVTSIPTRSIPKKLSWGRKPPQQEEKEIQTDDLSRSSGQILWIRGYSRVQSQLRVVRAFKSTLEDLEDRRTSTSHRGRGTHHGVWM
jgi:Ca2+ transporting ATPase